MTIAGSYSPGGNEHLKGEKKMEMKLVEKSFEVFKNFIGLLKTISEEMQLDVSAEGIKTMTMDPAHICMIKASMKPELVDAFVAPKEPEKIYINLAEMLKFLDRIGKDEQVKINYDEGRAKVNIHATKGGHRRRFTMPVLEPMEEEVPDPKINFKSSGRLLTQAVRRAIKDSNLVSEHMRIELTKEQMKLSAVGDIGEAYNEWDRGSDELLELKAEEDAKAIFTLTYLTDIFNALHPLCDVVTIDVSTDMPLKITAEPSEPLEIEIYLAPCIGT